MKEEFKEYNNLWCLGVWFCLALMETVKGGLFWPAYLFIFLIYLTIVALVYQRGKLKWFGLREFARYLGGRQHWHWKLFFVLCFVMMVVRLME